MEMMTHPKMTQDKEKPLKKKPVEAVTVEAVVDLAGTLVQEQYSHQLTLEYLHRRMGEIPNVRNLKVVQTTAPKLPVTRKRRKPEWNV